MTENSLTNVPKGGTPQIARNPASQRSPVIGAVRSTPVTVLVDFV
jgi:hypothetical protein